MYSEIVPQAVAQTDDDEILPQVVANLDNDALKTNFQGQFCLTGLTKDPYNFVFLTVTEGYNEKELKGALTDNIVKFLLELGNGFAFVGREYRLEVGKTEQENPMILLRSAKSWMSV